MGKTLMSLLVSLGLDPSAFNKGIEDAKGKAGGLQTGLAAVGGAIVTGGIAAVGAGVAALSVGLVQSVQAASEAADIQAQLGAVLKSTGGAAGVTADMANSLATNLSNVTKFEDDAIVSGENMLLTFTNIGKDVFPATTQTMLDMSQAMGTDLKSSAIMLGKALNDPSDGLSALTRVGVTFSEEQEKMVKSMQAAGDMAGAQGVILAELQKEFGGSAIAAGQTFGGQMEILGNKIGNVKEQIGAALLPALTQMATWVSGFVSSPGFQAWLNTAIGLITQFATTVMTWLPQIAGWFQQGFAWIMDNQGVIVGILAALGVAVGVFIWTVVIPALAAAVAAAAPVIAVMAAVGVAAYLLYEAWTNNWGGIRDTMQPIIDQIVAWLQVNVPLAIATLTNFWTNTLWPAMQAVWGWIQGTLFPIAQKLWDWLATNVPAAIQTLTDFWNGTLWPVMQDVWAWVEGTLFPIAQKLWDWLATNVPAAIQTLTDFWNGTLWPALQDVWAWIQDNLVPLLEALKNVLEEGVGVAATALAGIWENVLQPALETAWNFISSSLSPILSDLGEMLSGTVGPAVSDVASFFSGALADAMGGITGAIQDVIGWLEDLATTLANITLPAWMTPGSPTPWEIGLVGIADAMRNLARTGLPELQAELALGTPRGIVQMSGEEGGGEKTVINITAQYPYQPEASLQRDVKSLALLYGA